MGKKNELDLGEQNYPKFTSAMFFDNAMDKTRLSALDFAQDTTLGKSVSMLNQTYGDAVEFKLKSQLNIDEENMIDSGKKCNIDSVRMSMAKMSRNYSTTNKETDFSKEKIPPSLEIILNEMRQEQDRQREMLQVIMNSNKKRMWMSTINEDTGEVEEKTGEEVEEKTGEEVEVEVDQCPRKEMLQDTMNATEKKNHNVREIN